MQIKKELIRREIAGDIILVPVGKTVLESNGLFVLNGMGAFLWDRLEQAETAADLCEAVLAEYEVSREEAMKDIEDFLAQLEKLQIL